MMTDDEFDSGSELNFDVDDDTVIVVVDSDDDDDDDFERPVRSVIRRKEKPTLTTDDTELILTVRGGVKTQATGPVNHEPVDRACVLIEAGVPPEVAFVSIGFTRTKYQSYLQWGTVREKVRQAEAQCIVDLVADSRKSGDKAQTARFLLQSRFPSLFLPPNKSIRDKELANTEEEKEQKTKRDKPRIKFNTATGIEPRKGGD